MEKYNIMYFSQQLPTMDYDIEHISILLTHQKYVLYL